MTAATRPGVVVIDRPEPGKAGALNAGDQVASSLPRFYLDADIVVPDGCLGTMIERLGSDPGLMAVVPRRRLNSVGRPWPVRAYLAVNERLPAFRRGLFGRGLILVSADGRRRFDRFPELIADDLFLDSQFSDAEKAEADTTVVVEAPFTTTDLLRRLVRVRRGNAQMRAAAAEGQVDIAVRPADRWAWWRDVVRPEPRLLPAAVPYLVLTVIAAVRARRTPAANAAWGAGREHPQTHVRAGRGTTVTVHLCFHGIGTCAEEREPGEARYWVEPGMFLRILDEVDALPHVRLSFDDGNLSDVTTALPALAGRGLRATFFALAGRLDDPRSLRASDLRELRAAGMSIGSHGWDHVPWRGLDATGTRRELVDARLALADASDGPIEDAALPLGRYDRRLLGDLRRQGYRHVYTSDRLPSRPQAWLQPRYSVTATDTLESLRPILNGGFRVSDVQRRLRSLAKRLR